MKNRVVGGIGGVDEGGEIKMWSKIYKCMSNQEFTAVIQQLPDMDAAFVELPFDAEKVFGKKRVKVKAWFDGILYHGTLMRMGMSCDILRVTRYANN